MQNTIRTLIANQLCITDTVRMIGSLDHNEMNSLLADIEFSQSEHCDDYSIDTKHFLAKCKDILCNSTAHNMPKSSVDNFGNTVIYFDYTGSEGEFWMSYILNTDFKPCIHRSIDSIVYAHPTELRIIEFSEHVVYFRFGSRNTLMQYLSDVCNAEDGPHKCLFSPTYCLEFIDMNPILVNNN